MTKEQQIDEMAKDIYSLLRSDTMSRAMASLLYGEGYRKQSELISCGHENGGEWISVEDRLPEESDDYIVNLHYSSGTNIVTKRSYSKNRGWYGVSSDHYYLETAVSHWMPFPPPPTEKEN